MVSLINMAGCMHRSYVIGPLCSRCFTEDIILCDTATAIVWSFCRSCWSAISLSVFLHGHMFHVTVQMSGTPENVGECNFHRNCIIYHSFIIILSKVNTAVAVVMYNSQNLE